MPRINAYSAETSLRTVLDVAKELTNQIGRNVAGSKDPYYAREITTVQTSSLTAGVSIQSIQRVIDETLVEQTRQQRSIVGEMENAKDLYTSIEDIILGARGTEATFAHSGAKVVEKLKSLVAGCTYATRLEFTNALNMHCLNVNRASDNIQLLRGNIDQKVATDVAEANALLKSIADINDEILKTDPLSSAARDLSNQRSRCLLELSEYVKFESKTFSDGTMTLTLSTKPERLLLQDRTYAQFSYTPVPSVTASTTLSPLKLDGFGLSVDVTDLVQANTYTGGFKSSLNLRDELSEMQKMLDQYTKTFRDEINSVYCLSTPVDPPDTMTGIVGALGSNHVPLTVADQIRGQGTMRIGVMNTSTRSIDRYIDVDLNTVNNVQDFINQINTNFSVDSGIQASIASGALSLNINPGPYPDTTNFGIVIGSADPGQAQLSFGNAFDPLHAYDPKMFFGLQQLITTGSNVTGDADVRGISSTMAVSSDLLGAPNRLGVGVLTKTSPPDLAASVVIGDLSIARSMVQKLSEIKFNFNGTNVSQASEMTLDEYSRSIVDVLRLNVSQSNSEFEQSRKVYGALSKASFAISGVDPRQEMSNLQDILVWQGIAERMLSKIYAAKEKLYEI